MAQQQPTRERVIHKAKGDAAVVPVPAFNEAQKRALAEFVRDRIEALADLLGGEIGSLQKLERERLDSELGIMRAETEALRSEVARLRAERADDITAMKGRRDAAA